MTVQYRWETIQTGRWDLLKPLNEGDCSIEAKITAIIYIQIRNFDNRPLNTRWPLNAVSLNTSSTVFCFDLVLIKTFCSNDNTYHRLRLERGKVAMQPDNVFCLICRKNNSVFLPITCGTAEQSMGRRETPLW